jgi:hypothetical protein
MQRAIILVAERCLKSIRAAQASCRLTADALPGDEEERRCVDALAGDRGTTPAR